ncbi:SDR family oxidoreductase [Rhodococcus erythropolis]|uniref:SDR family oxidoreductase n=1 Tax=Rhodococcus erythropolis TaxID=1833 RepID=UPI002227E843|nr:SDR family NAD(P)-dependent oxidoreductase [Rhodococcus erythropolis]MCW2295434.1 NADP-dependent 3-hydroxy acid dehydrogenase YdfG [Rhodococcus erythropolis]
MTQTEIEPGAASPKVAWVVGAGSGIGRASALAIAAQGTRVILTGRRSAELEQLAQEIDETGSRAVVLSGDISNSATATRIAAEAYRWGGRIDAVVHCAGTNVAKRQWKHLSPADLDTVVATNYLSVSYVVLAALPFLREGGGGTVVITSSWAGWRYLGRVGPAYATTKSALAPLVETLNDEEGPAGIRATLLVPGEVATDLIRKHPSAPSESDLAGMLQPADVARMVTFVLDQPQHVCINELVVAPTANRLYGKIGVSTVRD